MAALAPGRLLRDKRAWLAAGFATVFAAALAGVALRTFSITTFFGIIPGAFAYAMFGAGPGTMFEAGKVPGFIDLMTPEILFAMAGLAALAAAAIPGKRCVDRRPGPAQWFGNDGNNTQRTCRP